MPITTERREWRRQRDYGRDGAPVGEYVLWLTVEVDRANNGTFRGEYAIEAEVDATGRPLYATNYRVNLPGQRRIDSTIGDPEFPPIPPGGSRAWSGFRVRIDVDPPELGLS